MNIPQNGRVVVIDDKLEEEALPLIKALAQTGVAVRFYTGKRSELPAGPLTGVRLLFLDLKLAGMELENDAGNIVNSLRPVLDRIIGKTNGPYVIVGWTKHPEHLKTLCESLDPRPAFWLNLEKSSCMTGGVCDIERVAAALKQKAASLEAFRLLFLWEHLVNESAYGTVNDFRNFYEKSEDPNLALSGLLYRLAHANLEAQIKGKPLAEILANALLALNGPFLDALETQIETLTNYDGFDIDFPAKGSPQVEASVASEINARLHLAKDPYIDAVPGNVYEPFTGVLKKLTGEVISECVKNLEKRIADSIKASSKGCILEVSAACDRAQGKWRRHRVVPGFIIPASLIKPVKRSDALFVSPVLALKSAFPEPFHLVFDFGYFNCLGFNSLKRHRPLFRLRTDLLVEIQSRLARHINRPGISSL